MSYTGRTTKVLYNIEVVLRRCIGCIIKVFLSYTGRITKVVYSVGLMSNILVVQPRLLHNIKVVLQRYCGRIRKVFPAYTGHITQVLYISCSYLSGRLNNLLTDEDSEEPQEVQVHVDVSLPGTPLGSENSVHSGCSNKSNVSASVSAATPTCVRLEEEAQHVPHTHHSHKGGLWNEET